jgi:hypothetical protein
VQLCTLPRRDRAPTILKEQRGDERERNGGGGGGLKADCGARDRGTRGLFSLNATRAPAPER